MNMGVVKQISLVVLCCVTVHVSAKQMYREKTYLSRALPEDNKALLWTGLAQQMDFISKKNVGTRVQARLISSTTDKDADFAQCFGVYNPSRNAVESFVGIDQNDAAEPLSSMSLIHDYARASGWYLGYGLRDRLSFRPQRRSWSVGFDLVQGFDRVFEGCSVRASIPYVISRSYMNTASLIPDAHGMNLPGTGTPVTLLSYLAGDVANTDPGNKQDALKKLKFIKDELERKGVGDIELGLRARCWEHDGGHFDLGLVGVIPSKHTPTGEFLSEPVLGNGGHIGLGIDGVLDMVLFEEGGGCLEFVVHADARYLLPANEIRTPLFNDVQGNLLAYGAYQLGGKVGAAGMFPLANVLTREFKVSPGYRLDISLAGIYSLQGFSVEFGAQAQARSKEKVDIVEWDDNAIGVVQWNYNATSAVTTANLWSTAGVGIDGVAFNAPSNLRTINRSSLNLDSITTPSSIQASLYGFVGYMYTSWRYPLNFGLGMMRDFALGSNVAAPSWNGWCKVGFTF